MTTYRSISDSEVDPESPVTTSLAQAWRDNPIAITEGASGAPRIQAGAMDTDSVTQSAIASGSVGQSEMTNNAVGRSELKTSTGSSSVQDGQSVVTLAGGEWAFCFETEWINTASGSSDHAAILGRADDITTPDLVTDDGGSPAGPSVWATIYSSVNDSNFQTKIINRYIQSSPPYDHGDGPVQGYAYAEINSVGQVRTLWMAEDPPWYGNTREGPKAQFKGKDGKEYARFVRPKVSLQDVREGRVSQREFRESFGVVETHDEEITSKTKLRGMDSLPQPILKPSGTVVLLDPMDERVSGLIELSGIGEDVMGLFGHGYLKVDNSELSRNGPPGVPVHAFKWSKT